MSRGLPYIESKQINRLAIPAILSGIAEPVISLVDTAFVGRIGTVELAAVGIATSFYLMTVWILAQTLTAIAAIVSRYYGSGKLGEIKSLIPQALFSNILLGLVFYALTNFFSPEIFRFYNAEGEVLDACISYFNIRSVGFPFTLATLLLFGTFRGLQNTSWAMTIALIGAGLNIILDYILIFGWRGVIAPMGIEGAAMASLISQILMFCLAILALLLKTPFNLALKTKINPEFKWLMQMSLDLFLRTILLNLTFYLATRFATGYGKAVIAAHTIALNIWLFSSFFIDGYAHAGNAIAGRLMGLNEPGTLHLLGKKIGKISLLIGGSLMVVYAVLYPFMAGFFTTDPRVIEVFDQVFWLVVITQPINALAFAFDGIYKGLGHTKYLRNLLIGATLLGFTPVVLAFHYISPSLMGIWIAFLVWMGVRAFWLLRDFKLRYPAPTG
ncbi:MAG: MATE family efflux transporter [Flavobacteriales bacterium]|nr:MATE family efflux transporter [Flavobacteriales bacterium]